MANAAIARDLMRQVHTAALATLGPDGGPFASYVTTAAAADGAPLLLLSSLAAHSRNLSRDPRASLLLVGAPEHGCDEMAAPRLTLTGRVLRDDNSASRKRFLAVHPDASLYAGFADFAFYRMHVEAGHLVAGFGRIVDFAAAELLA